MPSNPLAPALQAHIDALVSAIAEVKDYQFTADMAEDLPAFQAFLNLDPSLKKSILLDFPAVHEHIRSKNAARHYASASASAQPANPMFGFILSRALDRLRSKLGQTRLPFTSEELTRLVQDIAVPIAKGHSVSNEYALLRPVILAAETAPLAEETKAQLTLLSGYINRNIKGSIQTRKDAQRTLTVIDSLLGVASEPESVTLKSGDAWADLALAHLQSLPPEKRAQWSALFAHAKTLTSNRPSNAWRKKALALIQGIGADSFSTALIQWLAALDLPRTIPMQGKDYFNADNRQEMAAGHLHPTLAAKLLDPENASLLRALVQAAGALKRPDVTRAIGSAIISAYHKIPDFGCRSALLGNACIIALSDDPTHDGLLQLDLARNKVKYVQAQKLLFKAFNDAANALGITQDQLADMLVPAYQLNAEGKHTLNLGSITCTLQVTPQETVSLAWTLENGKSQASIPAQVKAAHPAELKELTKTAKEAQSVLRVQKNRLESTYLTNRAWTLDEWQKNIARHPLVSTLARRLIWLFESPSKSPVSAIVQTTGLVDSSGAPVTPPADSSVKLWHPLYEPIPTALAWRSHIESRQIVQPFKQAHREVYLLTDAETRTNTYSNRFAAHILRQHQFKALCDARGWGFDLHIHHADTGAGNALKPIPAHRLVAEYFVQPIAEAAASGVFLHLTTDQVRFYPGGDLSTPLPLSQIPPLVFSEVMRDVDLFVGVASVANDPNWVDSGETQPFNAYWRSFAFGELSISAQNRKDLLRSLVPRLKIAPVCSFDEKHLIVKGKLRTYKIHLGSGNIQMEPNNQYLCIVPSPAAGKSAGSIYLPFEGDSTLSIILSKALMLADDDKIKDPAITRQIKS